MTLLVRDEEDILEANLDYHLRQGVDFVIATDHRSGDGTPDILRRYERMGVLRMLNATGDEHDQSLHVTKMARLAAQRYDADWVINNDADEFWWPAFGSLKDLLSIIPQRYGQIEVRRHNFLPRREDASPLFDRLIVRESHSLNSQGLPLESKVAHRADALITIAPGNHSIEGAAPARAPHFNGLEIFHFPMRSYEQFERKVINTGVGYELLKDRSPGVGQDQLLLLELYRQGRLGEHFEAALLDDERLAAGLKRGTVEFDRRLAHFMNEPGARAQAGLDTDALCLLSDRMFAFAERAQMLERERTSVEVSSAAELEHEQVSRSHAVARLAEVESALAESTKRSTATELEVARLRAAHDLIMQSKTIRYSRTARLLYHRLLCLRPPRK